MPETGDIHGEGVESRVWTGSEWRPLPFAQELEFGHIPANRREMVRRGTWEAAVNYYSGFPRDFALPLTDPDDD